MSWATGLMVYLVIWWTVLFAVLPLGVRRVKNPGRGQDDGAPERPQTWSARRSSPRSSPPCSGSASISSTRRTSSASADWSRTVNVISEDCDC